MVTYSALIRFTEEQLNRFCLNYERIYSNPTEEAIHDFRVSCRRMLTLLDFFEFLLESDPKAASGCKRLRKDIRKWLKSMNGLRDLHILIGYVSSFDDSNTQVPDILKGQQSLQIQRLSSALPSWDPPAIRKKANRMIHTVTLADSELNLKIQIYLNYLTGQLHESVNRAEIPISLKTAHRIRIRLKEYRYYLELLAQGFHLHQPLISRLKNWQDQLGALQDLQMVIRQLQQLENPAPEQSAHWIQAAELQLRQQQTALQNQLPDLLFQTKQ